MTFLTDYETRLLTSRTDICFVLDVKCHHLLRRLAAHNIQAQAPDSGATTPNLVCYRDRINRIPQGAMLLHTCYYNSCADHNKTRIFE